MRGGGQMNPAFIRKFSTIAIPSVARNLLLHRPAHGRFLAALGMTRVEGLVVEGLAKDRARLFRQQRRPLNVPRKMVHGAGRRQNRRPPGREA